MHCSAMPTDFWPWPNHERAPSPWRVRHYRPISNSSDNGVDFRKKLCILNTEKGSIMNEKKDTVVIKLPTSALGRTPLSPILRAVPLSRFAVVGVYPTTKPRKFDITRYIANFGHRVIQAFRGL